MHGLRLATAALALTLTTAASARPPGTPVQPGPPQVYPTDTPWETPDLAPATGIEGQVTILPILFIPSDVPLPDLRAASSLLSQHLSLARAHYRGLLGATFAVERGQPLVHFSEHPDARFTQVAADTPDDRAHRVVAELFDRLGTDRYTTRHVLLVVYASRDGLIAGGGRTFNGAPGTGGGYVELDLRSLLGDEGYPFQSTLVHELGHAFGLTHSSCYGYDQQLSASIMSYNPSHHSTWLERSATPGGLEIEERLALDLAAGVFPDYTLDAADFAHALDLERVTSCFLGPMAESIGPIVATPGVGFELFHDGRLVSGADASLYDAHQADRVCQWNIERYPGTRVVCRYNGRRTYPHGRQGAPTR